VGKVAILVGDTDAETNLKAWRSFEVLQWCDAAEKRGFRISSLEDPKLREECYVELRRRTGIRMNDVPDR
jgi:hypothetical protein